MSTKGLSYKRSSFIAPFLVSSSTIKFKKLICDEVAVLSLRNSLRASVAAIRSRPTSERTKRPSPSEFSLALFINSTLSSASCNKIFSNSFRSVSVTGVFLQSLLITNLSLCSLRKTLVFFLNSSKSKVPTFKFKSTSSLSPRVSSKSV